MATDVLMPALSPTMTEGRLARWLKREGDAIAPGDVLAEIETDKATMEVEAVDEGTLGRILVADGTDGVAVNTPIAILLAEGETGAEPAPGPTPTPAPPPPAAATAPQPQSAPQPAPPPDIAERRLFASPLARRIAREAGLALDRIAGSGPNGRILRRDVEQAHADAQPPAPAPAPTSAAPPAPTPVQAAPPAPAPAPLDVPHHAVPNPPMRRAIARRLAASVQERPHFFVSMDVALDELERLRAALNRTSAPDGEPGAFRLSVNDMLVKSAAIALRRVPGIAVTYTDDAILHHDRIDVSVAVAIPDGLITPILRDADRKGLADLSNEARALFARAKAGKLKPDEFQGGGFSISNLGMFGVREFTAIINPPQSAILAIGAGEKRAVVRDDSVAIATMMTVTLSSDHRAIDGALAARFLAQFRRIVEAPIELML